MHGVFDHLPYATEYHSKTYYYDCPIDEESWAFSHVARHHGNANVVGRDDNIHFGFLRINDHTPWRWYHRLQVPYTLFVLSPKMKSTRPCASAFLTLATATSTLNVESLIVATTLRPRMPPFALIHST